MEKESEEYIRILKYLNFQKIFIKNELLYDIDKINRDIEYDSSNISVEQYNNIKKLIKILKPVEENYIYYILILESLPNEIIINLFRCFSYSYIRQYNLPDNEKVKKIPYYQQKYKMDDIIKNSNPKLILIETITELNKNSQEITKFFIKIINKYFLN